VQPVIGITCGEAAGTEKLYLNLPYIRALTAAGGLPVLLPGIAGREVDYLYLINGLLLSGGGDVDPFLFGEEPLPLVGEISPDRDRFEIELARLAMEEGIPVLGICRGIQVLNIAAGGTVSQDISLVSRASLKHVQQAPRAYGTHGLRLLPGSLLAGALGEGDVRVNSFHHQSLARLGAGLRPTAYAPDGIVEGIEYEKSWALGVQFHPEEMWEQDRRFLNIFKALVDASNAGRFSSQVPTP
jgi:putative glutamine amidotransferase